jgi:hypothetical protein
MNSLNQITTTTMNEIEISNKAFNLAYHLREMSKNLATLSDAANAVHAACDKYANGDLVPNGYNIDPINGTPFYVVYQPNLDGEIRGIYCRGVEVTDYLTGCTLERASRIAVEAVEDENTKAEDWQADQKIDDRCSGE